MALLNVENLSKVYRKKSFTVFSKQSSVFALNSVSLSLEKGKTLGVVGESGCGKSTLGKAILRLFPIEEGGVIDFEGKNISSLSQSKLRPLRKDMQMIFQDPYGSMNPRMTVREILEEPYKIHGIPFTKEHLIEVLSEVGLGQESLNKYPHEFSGGQKQRIVIARALSLKPKLIVCDEPVSALDVSIQAQILTLLQGLQEKYQLSYLFISHNLAVVENISHHVAVMYLGRIVEMGKTEDIFNHPKHPYTHSLLKSIPNYKVIQKRFEETIKGELPNPMNPPSGCAFHTRCPFATARCMTEEPKLRRISNQNVSCHNAESISF